jgi:predicted lipoprotein
MLNIVKMLLGCLLAFSLQSCDKRNPSTLWVTSVAAQIQQDYQALSRESQALSDSVQLFCQQQRNQDSIAAPRSQWRKTMLSWQHVQWVRFGPIIENNDDWKIQFWPDKKNIAERKVQKILQSDAVIDLALVEKSSVVIQGLSALELLLFDDAFLSVFMAKDATSERQCQLLSAVSTRLVNTTSRLAGKWQSQAFIDRWIGTMQIDSSNQEHGKALNDIVSGILAQMERVKIDKVGGPLGYKNRNKMPNGYFAESWRSQSSIENIKENLRSLAQLLVGGPSYNLTLLLNEKGFPDLGVELQQSVDKTLALFDKVNDPMHMLVMDINGKHQLESIYQSLGQLNALLKHKLPVSLGVSLGFNSNDGD